MLAVVLFLVYDVPAKDQGGTMSRMREEQLAFLETVNSASPYGECTREIRALQRDLAAKDKTIEALQDKLDASWKAHTATTNEYCKLKADLAARDAELAEARKDTERLMWWLANSAEWPSGLAQIQPGEESDGEPLPVGKWVFGDDVDDNYYESWRDAIDAVRESK